MALNIPLPEEFRDTLRQEQAWFMIIPVGLDSWRCQVTTPEQLSGRSQLTILKNTYFRIIEQLARAMESRDDRFTADTDLIALQELAQELFEALPPGTKQDLADRSPHEVFTTLQR